MTTMAGSNTVSPMTCTVRNTKNKGLNRRAGPCSTFAKVPPGIPEGDTVEVEDGPAKCTGCSAYKGCWRKLYGEDIWVAAEFLKCLV